MSFFIFAFCKASKNQEHKKQETKKLIFWGLTESENEKWSRKSQFAPKSTYLNLVWTMFYYFILIVQKLNFPPAGFLSVPFNWRHFCLFRNMACLKRNLDYFSWLTIQTCIYLWFKAYFEEVEVTTPVFLLFWDSLLPTTFHKNHLKGTKIAIFINFYTNVDINLAIFSWTVEESRPPLKWQNTRL